MNREEYIERLVAIYKVKYRPSELEIDEFKLLLEMMPDRPVLQLPKFDDAGIRWPQPYETVMYGCVHPYQFKVGDGISVGLGGNTSISRDNTQGTITPTKGR